MSIVSRKIISGLVLLIVGIVITIVKGDIPVNLLSLMQWIYSAFVLGNSTEYLSKAFIESQKNKN